MSKKKENSLIVFQGENIRRLWHNDEWYFSIIDVVLVLTDSNNPRNYWSMLKKREKEFNLFCISICKQKSM